MSSILRVDTIQDRSGNNGIGVDDISQGRAKAWVRFLDGGTIQSDFNVNVITDNGTGDYTVNFTDLMDNSNYCFAGTGGDAYGTGSAATSIAPFGTSSRTTGSCRFYTKQTGATGATNLSGSIMVVWWGD